MSFKAFDKLTERFLKLYEWDNGADRVIKISTIQMLLCFLFIMSSNLIFGNPIVCQVPKEVPSDSGTAYFEDYCFFEDKYRVSRTVKIQREEHRGVMAVNTIHEHEKEEIAVDYYQWTPAVLCLQVAMCLAPAMMWQFFGLHFSYGDDFAAIMQRFKKKDDDLEKRNEVYKLAAREAHRWLEQKKRERFGMHVTMTLYVLMKWLMVFSLVSQFYMMVHIFAYGNYLWGVHISYDLLNGVYKNEYSGVFPQIVGCKIHRTQLFNIINEFKMLCVLPQNFMSAKIFLFLYWWYILAILVSFSALRYTLMLFNPRYQRYATKSLLPTQEYFLEQAGREQHAVIPGDSDPMEFFVDYLGSDGFLLLQCSSVTLSVVSLRVFVNYLYDVVILKGGREDNCPIVINEKNPAKSPLDDIEFDGGARSAARKECGKDTYSDVKSKKNNKSPTTISDLSYEPLLFTAPSSSSSSQDDCHSPPPGKMLDDYQ